MKGKLLDTLLSATVYIIGIGAIGLILFWPSISSGDELTHEMILEEHDYDIPEIMESDATILNDSYGKWFKENSK